MAAGRARWHVILNQADNRPDDLSGWSIADEAALPACLLDRQFRYRQANVRWEARVRSGAPGLGDQEIILAGRSFLLDVPADRRERWVTALSDIVAGRLGHFLDEAVEAGPAGERVVVTTASPCLDLDGRVESVLCIRYDLTDARQATANEAELTRILEAARRLQHFLGNQLALTLGYVELMTLDRRLPPDLRERVDEALRGVVEATETLSRLRSLTRFELSPDDPSIAARYPAHADD